MAAYTKTLYDSTGANILYPQTLAQVVYTQTNENVEDVLNKKLTTPSGTQGQLLGFTSDNVVGAVDAPTSSSSSSPFNTSYNGTLASGSGNWTSSGNQYYQQITLSAITASQTPLLIPQWTSNISNEQESWNTLLNIQSFDGYIRIYAPNPTTTNVNFILLYTNYSEGLVELITNGSGTVGTFTPI